MASVQSVARYIVNELGSITTMKLQKLVYYCQAWSLAWDAVPLFDEDFQAWANGPVCPELFREHKGRFVVGEDFLAEYDGYKFTDDEIETINSVLEFYADKTPNYLSELTHKERPWKDARGNTPIGDISTAIITKDSMQDYYGGLT